MLQPQTSTTVQKIEFPSQGDSRVIEEVKRILNLKGTEGNYNSACGLLARRAIVLLSGGCDAKQIDWHQEIVNGLVTFSVYATSVKDNAAAGVGRGIEGSVAVELLSAPLLALPVLDAEVNVAMPASRAAAMRPDEYKKAILYLVLDQVSSGGEVPADNLGFVLENDLPAYVDKLNIGEQLWDLLPKTAEPKDPERLLQWQREGGARQDIARQLISQIDKYFQGPQAGGQEMQLADQEKSLKELVNRLDRVFCIKYLAGVPVDCCITHNGHTRAFGGIPAGFGVAGEQYYLFDSMAGDKLQIFSTYDGVKDALISSVQGVGGKVEITCYLNVANFGCVRNDFEQYVNYFFAIIQQYGIALGEDVDSRDLAMKKYFKIVIELWKLQLFVNPLCKDEEIFVFDSVADQILQSVLGKGNQNAAYLAMRNFFADILCGKSGALKFISQSFEDMRKSMTDDDPLTLMQQRKNFFAFFNKFPELIFQVSRLELFMTSGTDMRQTVNHDEADVVLKIIDEVLVLQNSIIAMIEESYRAPFNDCYNNLYANTLGRIGIGPNTDLKALRDKLSNSIIPSLLGEDRVAAPWAQPVIQTKETVVHVLPLSAATSVAQQELPGKYNWVGLLNVDDFGDVNNHKVGNEAEYILAVMQERNIDNFKLKYPDLIGVNGDYFTCIKVWNNKDRSVRVELLQELFPEYRDALNVLAITSGLVVDKSASLMQQPVSATRASAQPQPASGVNTCNSAMWPTKHESGKRVAVAATSVAANNIATVFGEEFALCFSGANIFANKISGGLAGSKVIEFPSVESAAKFAAVLGNNGLAHVFDAWRSSEQQYSQCAAGPATAQIVLTATDILAVQTKLIRGEFKFPPSLGAVLYLLQNRIKHNKGNPEKSTASGKEKDAVLSRLYAKVKNLIVQLDREGRGPTVEELQRVTGEFGAIVTESIDLLKAPRTFIGSAVSVVKNPNSFRCVQECLNILDGLLNPTANEKNCCIQ